MGQASSGAGAAPVQAEAGEYAAKVGKLIQAMEVADPSGEGSAEFARLLQREYRPPVAIEEGEIKVRSMDDLWRIARGVWASGVVPSSIKSVEALWVCLSFGIEAGLSITQSLRGVMVVNNVPSVWGDLAMALVRKSGLLEYIREFEEDGGEGEGRVAVCVVKRKGDPDEVRRTWSEADNKTAGLDSKDIHKKYPARMRKARARAFAIRDVFPDVLGGLAIKEEQDDVESDRGPAGGNGQDLPTGREVDDVAARARAKREAEELEALRAADRAAQEEKNRAAEKRLDSLLNPGKAAEAAKAETRPDPKAEPETAKPVGIGDASAEPPAGALEGEAGDARPAAKGGGKSGARPKGTVFDPG